MNGSLDQFKATLQRRKERQERYSGQRKDASNYKKSAHKSDFKFPKLKPKELEQFKETLRLEKENHKLKQISIFVSVCVFLVIVLLIINL